MSITSTNPISVRGYLSKEELEQYADIVIDDENEAIDKISQAEELIDAWAGFQNKYMPYDVGGKISTSTSSTEFALDSNYLTNYTTENYFKGCIVEMLSGPAAGQRRRITASTVSGVITCDAFTENPIAGSFYKIYQIGKFPRATDVLEYGYEVPSIAIKSIPENIKRATAAQVEFMIEMGDAYFAGDSTDITSESMGDYSYSKGSSNSGIIGIGSLIAPKAKAYMRGIRSIAGSF